jgi:hypothetical protein
LPPVVNPGGKTGIIYQSNRGLIKDYPEETVRYEDAMIEAGKVAAEVKLAPLSSAEAKRLILKLDTLAMEKANPLIASIVAEEVQSIITLVRMVKAETKAEFMGILGSGANLDICWLRAKHVGSSLLNSAGTASKGLYGGTSGGVLSWLHTFTAGTSEDLIPSQTMAKTAGVIHLGFMDPIEVPKVEAVQFRIANIPTPAQTLNFNVRLSFGTESLPVARLEKPVLYGPEKLQQVTVFPNIDGDSKLQPISFLVAKAEDLTL